jgi:hypothetical protein
MVKSTNKEKEHKRQKRMSEDKEYADRRNLQNKESNRKQNETPERKQKEHERYEARRKLTHPVLNIPPAAVAEEIIHPYMASFTPTPLLVSSQHCYSPSTEQHSMAASATNKLGADSIDGFAAMLASIDKRSYSRALLRDADEILERVIFPMSFPWTHRLDKKSPIIPYDVDEMPCVRAAEPVDQSKDATSVSDESTLTPRSIYPVRVTLSESTLSRKVSVPPSKRDDYDDEDINIPGELSFRMFLDIQARKRQRIWLELEGNESKMIAERTGSRSSRSKISEAQAPGKLPLVIPTHRAHHLQDKRIVSGMSKADHSKIRQKPFI